MFAVDTPLSQVKLGEIGAWISRRDKNPRAIAGAFSRAWWRWQHKYVQPKRAGIAPMLQLVAGSMIFFYAINYNKMRKLTEYFYLGICLTFLFFFLQKTIEITNIIKRLLVIDFVLQQFKNLFWQKNYLFIVRNSKRIKI